MLNRHFLRSKVLQFLYSYYIGDKKDMTIEESNMFTNIDKLYDLEVYLISTIFEMQDIAFEVIEEGKNKFLPTEEEKNPNMRFVQNPMFSLMRECEQLQSTMKILHINWGDQKPTLRATFDHFRTSDSYKDYMAKESVTYEEHRRIIVQMFKNYIIKNSNFFDELADKSFTWQDDYEYVCQIVIVLLRNWEEDKGKDKILPLPFDKTIDNEIESDRDYTRNLFRNTIIHWDDYEPIIIRRLLNWDRDRLAFIDIILIKMAISEFIYAPTIPVRVTLNEYIELAKEFSTEKSRLFVNGILDRIIIDLRTEGKIQKIEDDEYLSDVVNKEKKDEQEC